MRPIESERRTLQLFLTLGILGAIIFTACSPLKAQSNLDSPHATTEITTCIYESKTPPTPNEPVCLPTSPHLAGVPITLKDKSGNTHTIPTNRNGQIDLAGTTFFNSTDYPNWSIDYTAVVSGYCFAYTAIIEDITMPTWREYQFAYTLCPTK